MLGLANKQQAVDGAGGDPEGVGEEDGDHGDFLREFLRWFLARLRLAGTGSV
jgi:hypothetical protein